MALTIRVIRRWTDADCVCRDDEGSTSEGRGCEREIRVSDRRLKEVLKRKKKTEIEMAFNKTFAIFALAAACVVSAMSFASAEEETFMQFAYIMDATVGPSSVYEIIDSPDCSEMSAKEAMFDDKCHAEAKRICSMMDDCGGFVIEPADVSNPSESGFSIVVFTEGAPIYAMEGGKSVHMNSFVTCRHMIKLIYAIERPRLSELIRHIK